MAGRGQLIGATAITAMLIASTTPAMAREGRWHHRRDRDHVSTGAAVGAIALIGLVAAAAAASKPKPIVDEPMPPPYIGPDDGAPADPREAAAVDACIDYVGQHYAEEQDRVGRVEQITDVTPRTNGGFKVRGLVRVATWDGYSVQLHKFKCSINASGRSRSLTTTLARWPG